MKMIAARRVIRALEALSAWLLLTFSLAFIVSAQGIGKQDSKDLRVALVVGNGAYGVSPLRNPPHDARLIADKLKQVGFTLVGDGSATPLIDADRNAMRRAVHSFGDRLAAAGPTAVGLFFYAGHAVQSGGKNYLIPIGADITHEDDLEGEAISADAVLAQMKYAGTGVNLIILDACRDNPFRSLSRSMTRGLAEMTAPYGSLIEYSTAPGEVAQDGAGDNSPYSAALAAEITVSGQTVEQAFKRVRIVVSEETKDQQRPWESSSLIGDFYFRPSAGGISPIIGPPVVSAAPVIRPRSLPPPGTIIRDCPNCPEMVLIPPGKFVMGEDKYDKTAYPATPITIEQPFWMGRYLITRGEYAEFLRQSNHMGFANSAVFAKITSDDRRPVVDVNTSDAEAYAAWLSNVTGKDYRLPSEAEWEYAARSGTTTPFYWGDDPDGGGFKQGVLQDHTVELGCRPDPGSSGCDGSENWAPNYFGLFDISRFQWNLTADCWHDNYIGRPRDGSVWSGGDCAYHVYRGGAFNFGFGWCSGCRFKSITATGSPTRSFRVVRAAELADGPAPQSTRSAIPLSPPSPNQPATSKPYEDGLADRRAWERWFSGLSGAFKDGAEFWAAQRSTPRPGSCYESAGESRGDWTAGCLAAKRMLTPSDIRRKAEPEYRAGWNSYSG
jgi:formylglycine-generating enzyme required for sulfatase activity